MGKYTHFIRISQYQVLLKSVELVSSCYTEEWTRTDILGQANWEMFATLRCGKAISWYIVCPIAQVVSCRLVTLEARIRCQDNPHELWWISDCGTCFSLCTSVSPANYLASAP
jgi:hypothetical protein